MNKTNKKSLILKIVLLVPMLAVIIGMCAVLIFDYIDEYKSKTIEEYEFELEFTVWQFSGGIVHRDVVLTQDNPIAEFDMGVAPFDELLLNSKFTVNGRNNNGVWSVVKHIRFMKEESGEYGTNDLGVEIEYTVEQDGKIYNFEFNDQWYNRYLTDDRGESERCSLVKTWGVHRIKYKIPKLEEYGTDAFEFELVFNVAKDTREKTADIKVENYDGNILYTANQTGAFDMYICTTIPHFVVYDSETGEKIQNLESAYYVFKQKSSGELINMRKISEPGTYFCIITFDGNEECRQKTYMCYVVVLSQ